MKKLSRVKLNRIAEDVLTGLVENSDDEINEMILESLESFVDNVDEDSPYIRKIAKIIDKKIKKKV